MVDWKKEIKLSDLVGRKGALTGPEPTAEPAEAKTSVWKREIKIRRPKPSGNGNGNGHATAAPPAQTAIAEVPAPARLAPEPAPHAPEPAVSAPEPATPAPEPAVPSPEPDPLAPAATTAFEDDPSLVSSPRPVPRSRFAPVEPPVHATPTGLSREDEATVEAETLDAPEPDAEAKPKRRWSKQAKPKAATREKRPKPERSPKSPKSPKVARGSKKNQLVGLKIGASQLAAARVANNGSPQLLQVARETLEPGVVVAGELRDPEALAVALRDFFKKEKLPVGNVRIGIGNNRIGVRSFEITGVDDPKQLANAVRFRAQEALPIPIEEAVLDYQVVSEFVNEQGAKTMRVLLIVAYRDLVDRYAAACRKAGLKLAGIDLEAFAVLRALSSPNGEQTVSEDAAFVVVSIGHDRSTFAVSDGTVCEFTRVLDWGGGALDVALARTLDMTPSQAGPLKRALALDTGRDTLEGFSEEQTVQAYVAVRNELQSFSRELVSSLQFYQNQPGSLGIGEIVITGGTAHLTGLAAELQRMIGVRVRVGDPFARVQAGKRLNVDDQTGSLAVAIGLGIED